MADLSRRAVDNLGRDILSFYREAIIFPNQRNILLSLVTPGDRHRRLIDVSASPESLAVAAVVERDGIALFDASADVLDQSVRSMHGVLVRGGQRINLVALIQNTVIPSAGDIDLLDIDPTGTIIVGPTLSQAFIENVGDSAVTLTDITVEWDDAPRKLIELRIGGIIVWRSSPPVGSPSADQGTPAILDIVNVVFNPGDQKEIQMDWNGNFAGTSVTIAFIMADSSSKTVTLIGLPPVGTTRFRTTLVMHEFSGGL